MTEDDARLKTIELFGDDSFTETDEDSGGCGLRYYVGPCPTEAGVYQGAMGFSWDEALEIAARELKEHGNDPT